MTIETEHKVSRETETHQPDQRSRDGVSAKLIARVEATETFRPTGDIKSDVLGWLAILGPNYSDMRSGVEAGLLDPRTVLEDERRFLEGRVDPTTDTYLGAMPDDVAPDYVFKRTRILGSDLRLANRIAEASPMAGRSTEVTESKGDNPLERRMSTMREGMQRRYSEAYAQHLEHIRGIGRLQGEITRQLTEIKQILPAGDTTIDEAQRSIVQQLWKIKASSDNFAFELRMSYLGLTQTLDALVSSGLIDAAVSHLEADVQPNFAVIDRVTASNARAFEALFATTYNPLRGPDVATRIQELHRTLLQHYVDGISPMDVN